MPLTANTVYDNTARLRQLNENWLFEFDNSASGTLRLAFADCYVGGNLYRGMVTGEPSIRSSIDLVKSRLSISNFSIEVANGKIAGANLSELLLFASTKYINWPVRVYSQLTGNETLANCKQIFSGRLVNVSHGVDTITLDVEEYQPWQFLQVPNVKTTGGRYFPVVYGDFAYNSSTPTTMGYCQYRELWPSPVDSRNSEALYCLMPQAYASNVIRPHYYEEGMDRFVPIVDDAEAYVAGTESTDGGYRVAVDCRLIHAIKYKPTGLAQNSTWPSTFTDPADSFDLPDADDTSTYAEATVTSTAKEFYLQCPNGTLDVYDTTASAVQFKIETPLNFSRSGAPHPTLWISVDGGSSFIGQYQPVGTGDVTVTWTIDSSELAGGVLPQQIGFYFFISGGTTSCTLQIKDIRIKAISRTSVLEDPGSASQQEKTTNERRANDQANGVKEFYFGADGLTRSWTTGAVTEIHELHRDLLYRFAGYTTEPAGWSALGTARSGWTVRWWLHEPVEVIKLLEQAQYEGGFIFAWAPDGTSQYIYVKSSYSGGDVTYTLDERDISGLRVSHTPFGDMVTKKTIQYERHPATGKFRHTEEYANTTARTAYNIQSLENIENVELEMLVGNADEHGSHYGRINGTIKCLLDFSIVNPLYWGTTVGDILQFTAARMPAKAFAADWTQYFMVTSVQRRRGVLQVSAREVG